MAAIDSLVGLIDLRKADGLVLEANRVPTLLGGPGGGSLTMPPVDTAMMAVFLEDLLSAEETASVNAGKIVERDYQSAAHGSFVIKARLESGRAKVTIRRGVMRRVTTTEAAPSVQSAPVAHETSAQMVEPIATNFAEPAAVLHVHGSPFLQQILSQAVARNASDVFLSAGRAPLVKVLGQVSSLDSPVLSEERLLQMLDDWLTPPRRAQLASTGSVDFALAMGGNGQRFRVNLFRQLHGLAAALRPIVERVPELSELGLPRSLLRLVAVPHGLVLMTGPTGSGKSTTLAALLAHVNRTRACHVVTLEDPIEYQFPPGQALFHQREVGSHVSSFGAGLRAALRESPDILLVGEMRDPETIALALTAAETGHLVFSTMHAGSAVGAIDRIVNAFAESQRASMRTQIAACLRFVVTQHLVIGLDGLRIPVVEQLAVNQPVAAQIRDGRTQLLATQMELGNEDGMVTLEASLLELVRNGRISSKTALEVAPNREAFEGLLAGLSGGSRSGRRVP
jgi:twitching motility protein PilT